MKGSLYVKLLGGVILLGVVFAFMTLYRDNQAQKALNATLQKDLKEAQEISKEAIVTRRVSAQLEEIAYQQKDISDHQRQEALHQKGIADEMRMHAEYERKKALEAQQVAIEAYSEMEAQKRLADQHREEAVAAQMKADTLARLALARSLSSEALSQYEAGNNDLAALLCYSAWKFTVENRGDVYQPTLFDALSSVSDLYRYQELHRGAIRSMCLLPGPISKLVTASQEGELALWDVYTDRIERDTVVCQDGRFDFRFVQVDDGRNCWVLSYDGSLLRMDPANGRVKRVYSTGIQAPVGFAVEKEVVWVMARNGQLFRSDGGERFTLAYTHDTEVTTFICSSRLGFLFGDRSGRVYRVDREGRPERLLPGFGQAVTCLNDEMPGQLLVGYGNGLIKQFDLERSKSRDLVGHLSSLTGMALFGDRLLSSSMDGTVRLWRLRDERISSSEVYNGSSWIRSLLFWEPGLMVIVGDERGVCARFSISPDRMAEEIRRHLTRDFTSEEWQYYIGELAEYETYRK